MVDELRESHESARLQALRLYRVLDTAGERTFDELAELAAAICDTPISLISLVDGDRQWFKSRVGLEVRETPRCMAFCAHAIETDAVTPAFAWLIASRRGGGALVRPALLAGRVVRAKPPRSPWSAERLLACRLTQARPVASDTDNQVTRIGPLPPSLLEELAALKSKRRLLLTMRERF